MSGPVILFDADGTLLDFDAAERNAFRRLFQERGWPDGADTFAAYKRINERYWLAYEKGEISKETVTAARFDETFRLLGIREDGAAFNHRFQEALMEGSEVVEGAREVCARLSKSCPLYIVTNGVARTQRTRFGASGLAPYFEGVFISEEIGWQKPRKEFFDHVFSVLGQERRKEAWIVGDSLTSDILGGKNAGITTCWFHPDTGTGAMEASAPIQPDYEIRRLDELFQVLLSAFPDVEWQEGEDQII